jgi:glycine cleavage system H protein
MTDMIPAELQYSETHEWVRVGDDGCVTIGITEHAQHLLGDVVYADLPDVDLEVHAGNDCAVLESVKAAVDVLAPVSGKIIAVNDDLVDSPDNINKDPYGEGWILRIELADPEELDALLDHDGYSELLESESEENEEDDEEE